MKKTTFDSLMADYLSPTLMDSVGQSRPVGDLVVPESISESEIRELERVLELEFGEKITLKITDEVDTDF